MACKVEGVLVEGTSRLGLRNFVENNRIGAGLMLASVVVVSGTIAGCGNGESNPTHTYASPTASTEAVPWGSPELPRLVFDALNTGSSIIAVYPGVGESAADRQPNGTFSDGQSIPAECQTEGRIVTSEKSPGHNARTSNVWIRIEGTPGETQYATAVYVEDPTTLLGQLKPC